MSVAPVLQLEAALLRRQMPDLLLRPGMTLFARVAEREGRHGIIVLAGSPSFAAVPGGGRGGGRALVGRVAGRGAGRRQATAARAGHARRASGDEAGAGAADRAAADPG